MCLDNTSEYAGGIGISNSIDAISYSCSRCRSSNSDRSGRSVQVAGLVGVAAGAAGAVGAGLIVTCNAAEIQVPSL